MGWDAFFGKLKALGLCVVCDYETFWEERENYGRKKIFSTYIIKALCNFDADLQKPKIE